MSWLLVAVGSALGGMARFGCGLWIARLGLAFPWSTLLVNVLGSFTIGLVAALSTDIARAGANALTREFVIIGLLGGFTTFSAFSLQTIQLLQAGKSLMAFANVAASVALCLGATWLGFVLAAR